MEETLRRCECGQLVNWADEAEAAHHSRPRHKPMPGFTDDRRLQGELDLESHDPAGWAPHLAVSLRKSSPGSG